MSCITDWPVLLKVNCDCWILSQLRLNWCSDAQRTRETLRIMQEEVQGFSDAEVHFLSSFYSVAAMDGQTAEHLQQSICEYSRDEILTVM